MPDPGDIPRPPKPPTCRHCGRMCWYYGGACAGRQADIDAGRLGRPPKVPQTTRIERAGLAPADLLAAKHDPPPDPGDIIGHVVSAVRTCARGKCLTYDDEVESFQDANDYWDMETRCTGCRGDGTYRAEEVATVEPWGAWLTAERDGKPWCNHSADEWCEGTHTRHQMWRERPVENGDTDE